MADVSLLPSKPDITNDSGPRVVGIEGDDADELLSALASETAREIVAALHDDPAPPSELADRVDSSLQNVQYHLSRLDDAGVVEVAGTAYSEKGREMDVYAPADDPLVIVAAEDEQTSGLRAMLSRLLGGVGALLLGSAAVQQLFGDGILPGPFGGTGAEGSGAAPESTTESDGGAVTTSTPTEAATETATETAAQTATETAAQTATETPAGTPTPAATTTPTPQATATETATPAAETLDTVTESVASWGIDLVGTLPPGVLFFLGGLVVLVAVAALSYGKRSV
ncbi:ArsR family transcriptional regulator [Halobacteriales archaeon QS_9_67_17]|nr:MAG: ArsR family transcriptional regulator [Halobacteriales archaeon QS_9_67_17]